MQLTDLTQFSTQALLDGISELLGSEREITAKLLAHLGEVEERRLHLEMGHSSMFDFCVTRYKMSEGQAFRRVLAARLARRFPVIHSLIASGRLHLTALQMLGERLTPENHVELLEAACHTSKRELEAWLAARFPKPDVPAQIRKLPARRTQSRGPAEGLLPGMNGVPVRRPNERGRLEPLSESRFRVEFTASAALREKLERARDLMSHANPSREVANVVESALDLLLEKLESRRLGKLKRSQRKPSSRAGKQSPARVSREVRRQVFARDGEQCTFVGPDGHRCSARSFLELDHIDPLGLGGASDVANIRVRCRSHNQLWAEQAFGREHVAARRDFHRRKSSAALAGQLRAETAGDAQGSAHQGAALLESGNALDKVRLALKRLGFRDAEARRAVAELQCSTSLDGAAPGFEQLLREALRTVPLGEPCQR